MYQVNPVKMLVYKERSDENCLLRNEFYPNECSPLLTWCMGFDYNMNIIVAPLLYIIQMV